MRIAFLIATLSPGGAERVAVTLCDAWAAAGNLVDLLTYQEPGERAFYCQTPGVTARPLGLT